MVGGNGQGQKIAVVLVGGAVCFQTGRSNATGTGDTGGGIQTIPYGFSRQGAKSEIKINSTRCNVAVTHHGACSWLCDGTTGPFTGIAGIDPTDRSIWQRPATPVCVP